VSEPKKQGDSLPTPVPDLASVYAAVGVSGAKDLYELLEWCDAIRAFIEAVQSDQLKPVAPVTVLLNDNKKGWRLGRRWRACTMHMRRWMSTNTYGQRTDRQAGQPGVCGAGF
jgi:hypothetical protein